MVNSCDILRAVKRMTPQELDDAAARLEEIGLEEEALRSKLQEQVEAFGFTPPARRKVEATRRHAVAVHSEPRTYHGN
jgi:hypothetical protein